MPKLLKTLLVDGVFGIAGGVVALLFAVPALGHDQPLSLLLVGLGIVFGRFAFLAPAAVMLCGVVLGVVAGRVIGWAMR